MEKKRHFIRDNLLLILLFCGLIFFVFFRPFTFVVVKGRSMEPTFHTGDIVFFQKYKGDINALQKGNLTIVSLPPLWEKEDNKKDIEIIKRIKGLPGDTLELKDDAFYINGELCVDSVQEKFKGSGLSLKKERKETIPPGSFFVMGDNVGHSFDSFFLFLRGDKNYLVPFSSLHFVNSLTP